MTYLVTAPLVIAPNADGALGYHYQDTPIAWLSPDDAARLIADGLVVKINDSEAAVAAPSTDTPSTAGAGVPTAPDRPAPTDPKPEWIAYGVAAGLDQAVAEAMTKNEIAAAVDALIAQ